MGTQNYQKKIDLAYIAGFLDGDGSVMLQLKKRKDTPKGLRLMFTISFCQDTRYEKPLFWIRNKLGIGYISHRKDGMTELRVNGYKSVGKILKELAPFVKFKKEQFKWILKAIKLLERSKKVTSLSLKDKQMIIKVIVNTRRKNYQSGKKTKEKLCEDLKKIVEL